jgi:hypothetical protein
MVAPRPNPTRSGNLQTCVSQWILPAVPFETRHFGQINETLHQVDLRLGVRGTLGLPPFIQAKPAAPAPPADNREENSPCY